MLEETVRELPAPEERDWRSDPHELGARGERVAVENLRRRGWNVLQTNWQSGFGEVDIIAVDPTEPVTTAVLVEVKTRRAREADEVMPELAVDEERQRRYAHAAIALLRAADWAKAARFDVIAITVTPDGIAHLHHLKRAYEVSR